MSTLECEIPTAATNGDDGGRAYALRLAPSNLAALLRSNPEARSAATGGVEMDGAPVAPIV